MATGFNKADQDAVFKDFYIGPARETLNNEVFLLSQMERNSEDIEGRAAVFPVHLGRNEGVGARRELQTLPTAGRQTYAEVRVPVKSNYGRIQISGQAIRSSGSDRGSFVRATQSETMGVVKDLRNDVARQTYVNGTGAIATVTSNTGAVVTLTSPTAAQLRQLRPGMVVDIGTTADPDNSGTATISSVDRSAGTVTLDATVAVTSGHFIFRTGSGGTGATQSEITGLAAQVAASGTLWGVDPTVHDSWASQVFTSAGAVSEDMFIEAAQEVDLETGEDLDLWITDNATHRWVAGLLTSIKRFPGEQLNLKGGWRGLDMSDVGQGQKGPRTVAMVYDKDMPLTGSAYGLTTSRWQCYEMSDWEFMDEDGSVLNRVANTDAYEAVLYKDMEMATDNRAAHALITGITAS